MGLNIEDGTGKGYQVKVNSENQMETVSVNHELQHHISRHEGTVYQIIGGLTDVWNGTNVVLHINNSDPARKAVISYMRFQCPGPSGSGMLPDNETYFQIGRDTTYSSGGTEATAVNMNLSSGNEASLAAYKDNPAVTGTFTEFDRWYPTHSMMTFNKHGSLILGLDDSIEVRLVTNRPELPNAYCRITIMMMDI